MSLDPKETVQACIAMASWVTQCRPIAWVPPPGLSQCVRLPTEAEKAFLDAFWKHYLGISPQEACLLSLRSPARIRATRDRTSRSLPSLFLPRHRRAARPQLTPPDALSVQLQSILSISSPTARCSPHLHADATPRTLPAQPPLSLHRSRSRRQRAALDPSPPPSNVPPSRLL